MPTASLLRTALTALTALLALALGGCAVMSTNHYTTLPKEPAARADAALPVPVAFVVHPAMHFFSNPYWAYELEAESWVAVLSQFTDREHIYVYGAPGTRREIPPAFAEFARTHPAVEITVQLKRDMKIFALGLTSVMLNAITSGLVPTPAISPMSAEFTLTLPGAQEAQPTKHDYPHYRLDSFAPVFFLLPLGNDTNVYFGTACAECNRHSGAPVTPTDWRAEEKRRLLGQFLRDAMPLLKQYGQQAGSAGAAAVP